MQLPCMDINAPRVSYAIEKLEAAQKQLRNVERSWAEFDKDVRILEGSIQELQHARPQTIAANSITSVLPRVENVTKSACDVITVEVYAGIKCGLRSRSNYRKEDITAINTMCEKTAQLLNEVITYDELAFCISKYVESVKGTLKKDL